MRYTTIIHDARIALELSMNDYCIADCIYHYSNNPKNKSAGWCFASKQHLADQIGITKAWVIRSIQSLELKGLVEKSEDGRLIRTTSKWYKAIIEDYTDGIRSIPIAVNGVYQSGIQSIPPTYNKSIDRVDSIEESNDSSSKKPVLAKAKSETKTKKEGGGPVYVSCVEHWLKVAHPGWGFKAVDGKAMKGIMAQMVQYSNMKQLKDGDSVKYPSDEQLINFFKHFCKSLPEFYKSQTLTVLNTKFDSIIETIKRSDGKGKQPVNWNNPKDTSAIIRNLR